MYSKFFIGDRHHSQVEQGFLLIELLIGLILVSITTLGVSLLLLQNRIVQQQTEWGYRAVLSASNLLESQSISNLKQSSASVLEWQDDLSETFPNSKIQVTITPESISLQCLPPLDSKLKVIALEW